jgi:hypothetical protein
MGDQACERFEKKWQMSGIEFHWNTHKRQCELEDEQLEAESKSLPDKLQAVTAELQELTRKVGGRVLRVAELAKLGKVPPQQHTGSILRSLQRPLIPAPT